MNEITIWEYKVTYSVDYEAIRQSVSKVDWEKWRKETDQILKRLEEAQRAEFESLIGHWHWNKVDSNRSASSVGSKNFGVLSSELSS